MIIACKYMFKQTKDRLIIPLPSQNTRLHDGVVLPKPDLTNNKYMRFLPWLGPAIWNTLPADVRNEKCYSKFAYGTKCEFKARFSMDETYKYPI